MADSHGDVSNYGNTTGTLASSSSKNICRASSASMSTRPGRLQSPFSESKKKTSKVPRYQAFCTSLQRRDEDAHAGAIFLA